MACTLWTIEPNPQLRKKVLPPESLELTWDMPKELVQPYAFPLVLLADPRPVIKRSATKSICAMAIVSGASAQPKILNLKPLARMRQRVFP